MSVLFAACVGCAANTSDDWDVLDGKADGAGAATYGELAATKAAPALASVEQGLLAIDQDVMPDEAKPVRKQLAELRDYFDLFAYAYPTAHGDPWRSIRRDLDDGYETIGAFKDLFDRQGIDDPQLAIYEPEELAARRHEVLVWKTAFDASYGTIEPYIDNPDPRKLFDRDNDDLSPFFWGATSLEPSKSRSGLKNMAKLTRELLELSLDDYDRVLELRKIHRTENQEHFHDFRKRLRSIARMPGYFPPILEADADVDDELAVIAEAVDRYGTLNDLISRYAHDPDNDLEKDIAQQWGELREWQHDEHLDRVLDRLHDAIRK